MAVGKLCRQGRKILRDGSDKSNAGREACERKNSSQQDSAGIAEQLMDDAAERPGAVFLNWKYAGRAHSHVCQDKVDAGEDSSGKNTGHRRIFHHAFFLFDSEAFDGCSYDKTEIQSGDSIHRQITFEKAFYKRGGTVAFCSGSNVNRTAGQEAEKQEKDKA